MANGCRESHFPAASLKNEKQAEEKGGEGEEKIPKDKI